MKNITLSQLQFNALFSSFPFKQYPYGISYCGVSYFSNKKSHFKLKLKNSINKKKSPNCIV